MKFNTPQTKRIVALTLIISFSFSTYTAFGRPEGKSKKQERKEERQKRKEAKAKRLAEL